MQALPQFQSEDKDFQLMQNSWGAVLNVLLKNPSLDNVLLKGISLSNGATVINHKLGRTPQGWRIVDIDGAATVYRSQPFNNLTLTLTSNAAVTVSLEVF
jgi:hypothetical protein